MKRGIDKRNAAKPSTEKRFLSPRTSHTSLHRTELPSLLVWYEDSVVRSLAAEFDVTLPWASPHGVHAASEIWFAAARGRGEPHVHELVVGGEPSERLRGEAHGWPATGGEGGAVGCHRFIL